MSPTHPFGFLSNCFLYPDQRDMQTMAQTLVLLADDLDLPVTGGDILPATMTELQAEYIRLFVNGPGGVAAPPYASVYINSSGLLHQQGYEEAMAFYSQAGLKATETDECGDHIGHELAFVGLLLDQQQEKLLSTFLKRHLLRWYPPFKQRLLQADPFPFYKILAQVTDLSLQYIHKEVLHEQTAFS